MASEGVTDGAVVLLSGGMDSSALVHYVGRELGIGAVRAITFMYGQKHARELEMARLQARSAGVVEHREADVPLLGELTASASALTDDVIRVPDLADLADGDRDQPSTYVPNRNMVLVALSAAWAESVGVADVYYAAQEQDEYGYWDCTTGFVRAMNEVLSLNRRRTVALHAPFVGMTKADVLKKGLELGVDYSHTWTCYRGGEAPCRTCPSCVERAAAFHRLGVQDPLIGTPRSAGQ